MTSHYLFCSWIIVGKVYIYIILQYTAFLGRHQARQTTAESNTMSHQWRYKHIGWEQIVIGFTFPYCKNRVESWIYPAKHRAGLSPWEARSSWEFRIPPERAKDTLICLSFHWLRRMCHCSRNLSTRPASITWCLKRVQWYFKGRISSPKVVRSANAKPRLPSLPA